MAKQYPNFDHNFLFGGRSVSCPQRRLPVRKMKPVLMVMHEAQTCPGHIGRWLVRNGFQIEVLKPRWNDPLPETLEGYSGVVMYGGNMSANDADAFIKNEIDWLDLPLRDNKPFLGICLGGQLLVKALGGRVEDHPRGIVESGYYPVMPTKEGLEMFPGLAFPSHVYEWHAQGFDRPSGMSCLLSGEVFENQLLAVGERIFAFQFHPEISERLIRRWTLTMPDLLDRPGAQPIARQLAGHLLHLPANQKWLDGFMKRWVAHFAVCEEI